MTIARVPVTVAWNYGTGSPGANVWHLRWDGPLEGSAQVQTLLDLIEDFYTGVASNMTTGVDIDFDGEIQGLGLEQGNTATYNAFHVDGAIAGNPLPTSQQIVVAWKTQSGGRRGRGRTFVGPLAVNTLQTDGRPFQSAVDDIQAAADALVSGSVAVGNGAVGVFSRLDNVVRDVTSAEVDREYAVLRSRRD